jgi:hypothetical protein
MNLPVPEDLKESKLRFNVTVKLLGGLRKNGNAIVYTPSIRRLPSLGAAVGMPNTETLKFICSLGITEDSTPVEIGHLALGDNIFDGTNGNPDLEVQFDINRLNARRTFVFARAGYGKSVLIKLLITKLYENNQDTGMLIFDPEGEYFFPDQQGRPGLVNIPELASKIVIFTDRKFDFSGTEYEKFKDVYESMIAGPVKLNLSELNPSDVISICYPEEKQELVSTGRLKALDHESWKGLLSCISEKGYGISNEEIKQYTQLDDASGAQGAVRNNLPPIVMRLHDESSRMMDQIKFQLKRGNIVVVDISLLSSAVGNQIAGLVLNEIFRNNQRNFTAGSLGELIKTVAVIEEAQSVLPKKLNDASPFVAWTKEGRKYDLGSILVTQQPGSIAPELLSQGDNFFVFHLLSEHDLKALQFSNAHYSNDLLASILNEPIKGNAYFWSAPDQPFVMSAKITNFEEYVKTKENEWRAPEKTAAQIYRESLTGLADELNNLILRLLERDYRTHIFANLKKGEEQLEGICAVKKWNLIFQLGERMSAELFDRYGEYARNGSKIINERTLLDHLMGMEVLAPENIAFSQEGEKKVPYYLLKSDNLNLSGKVVKKEEVVFQ